VSGESKTQTRGTLAQNEPNIIEPKGEFDTLAWRFYGGNRNGYTAKPFLTTEYTEHTETEYNH